MADGRRQGQQVSKLKAIVIGDGACGKTCLLHVFQEGSFPEDNRYIPTVFETSVSDMVIDGRNIELSLWDTAGQEEFDRLRLLCYPDVNVVIICFSVDSPDSLENVIDQWHVEAKAQAARAPVVLAALKLDLRDDQRVAEYLARYGYTTVSRDQGERVAAHIGATAYIECSSVWNQGVTDVFEAAARAAVAKTGAARKAGPRDSQGGASPACCIIL